VNIRKGYFVILGLVATLLPAAAQQQQGSGPNPPFDVYINTQSEDGRHTLTVRCHRNGTFLLTAGGMRGGGGTGPQHPGVWWWQDGKFCFAYTDDSGLPGACKANGHYIGTTSYAAGGTPVTSARE
jgi:hypothetical protein